MPPDQQQAALRRLFANGTGLGITALTPQGQSAYAGVVAGAIRAILSVRPQTQVPPPPMSQQQAPEPGPSPEGAEADSLALSPAASAAQPRGLDPLLAAAVFASGVSRPWRARREEDERATFGASRQP